ncbi:hypothetical protein [Bacteroides sp. 51]|uniref:hypothetical protein n=1 Tax=Bacteroides sp. 51 TaxID=2302938 RepID=UPI0013D4782F|nr:hypothetical protein [Bacteroides sp. 51]NDV84888.1 hypothetical protein [Bacteroides sp. 51]
MSKASELIADSIIGQSFVTVLIAGKAYTMYPPVIKVICRAISAFSKVDLKEEYTRLSILGEIPTSAPHITSGIASLLAGNTWNWRWKKFWIKKKLQSATIKELNDAFIRIIPLIGGDDFFAIATCAKNVTTMVAKAK